MASLAALALILTTATSAFGGESVHRGPIVRQGNVWSQREECAAPVKDGARLVLSAEVGSVRIDGGVSGKVTCEVALHSYTADESQARRLFSQFKLSVKSQPDGDVLIKGVSPQGEVKLFNAEYRILVPAKLNLDLETRRGGISVNSPVEGSVRATTAAGDVSLSDASGTVSVETAGGNIRLGNLGSGVEARTAGGGIRIGAVKGNATLESNGGDIVTGEIAGTAKVETAGGDISLGGAGGAIQAITSAGQIQIGKADGSVMAQSAGGSVRIGGASGVVRVETTGGSIDLYQLQGPVQAVTRQGSITAQMDGPIRGQETSTLSTSAGDIQVYLPQNLPLTIDASIQDASGHRIISDFPVRIQGGNPNMLQKTVYGQAVLNGGGGVLKIRCVDGNIEIRKLDSRTLEFLKTQKAAYWKQSGESKP